MKEQELLAAHEHCKHNKEEILASENCVCFYCAAHFKPAEIVKWVDKGGETALCPECGIDAVIGDKSGLDIDENMAEMYEYWFGHDVLQRVLYTTDGEGHWTRTEWPLQCCADVIMAPECQGVKGHTGDHWSYRADGSYAYQENNDYPGGGSIPPDNKDYISPKLMVSKYWLSHSNTTEVTDKELIARLERGESGPGESIDRPCTPEEEAEIFNDE